MSIEQYRKFKTIKRAQPEATLQLQICNYLRTEYPDIIFTSESSGVKLTMGQAVKAKQMRSSGKLPDLWILEPAQGYHGLFVELKVDSIHNKKGEYKTEHIRKQAETIERLNDKGYYACFAIGFDQAIKIIEGYLNKQ